MALIKSALELALEKTKDMKVDPAAIEAAELRQEGKKAAGLFLDDPSRNELYDLKADSGERTNLFGQPVNARAARHHAWARR